MATPTATWQSFSLQIPGQSFLESARSILEQLVVYLEILKTLLDSIKALLTVFGNPIAALVQALIALINTLFEALKQTGIYGWFDIPDPTKDPNFNRFVGGYQALVTRFKASLVDSRDPGRPQPVAGATQSGFILLVVDAEGISALVRLTTLLLKFFGTEFAAPHYLAPSNVRVLPVGDNGDPILAVAQVFELKPKSLVVEWALPTTQNVGDPGFSDVFSSFATEFVPPKFLIEKSTKNPNVELDAAHIATAGTVGQVTATVPTNFELRGAPGATVKRKIRLTDFYGDAFIKFEKYIVVDATQSAGTFFLGQLGTFRYIDNDVLPGQAYWYRVRAYSGSLTVNSDGSIPFAAPAQNPTTQQWEVAWPGDNPVMGRASVVFAQRVPLLPATSTFDVFDNLRRLFQLAFSLNFHLELTQGKHFNSAGLPDNATTYPDDIGKGSLTQQAGPLVAFTSLPILGAAAGAIDVSTAYVPDPATGAYPTPPWQQMKVKRNATRLATLVAGALLESNNAESFRQLMTGPLLKGSPATSGLSGDTNLSAICLHMTPTDTDPNTLRDASTLFGNAFQDPQLRLNLLQAINFCKTFTFGGTPPDWIQISLLRDIVPWTGQLLYELLAKIQGLLNGFQGVADEIKAFVDLIERKIDTLEKFIEYLVSLLDFVLNLSLGFYVLFVPQSSGDASEWASAVDNAQGTPPPSGPGGYSAGVALAYVGPDVSAMVTAFKLIF